MKLLAVSWRIESPIWGGKLGPVLEGVLERLRMPLALLCGSRVDSFQISSHSLEICFLVNACLAEAVCQRVEEACQGCGLLLSQRTAVLAEPGTLADLKFPPRLQPNSSLPTEFRYVA